MFANETVLARGVNVWRIIIMVSKRCKILLLSVSSTSFFYDQLVIPFGLVSIASYVEDEGYDIKGIEMNIPPKKILDRYLRVDEDLLNNIMEYSPDIIGMSTYSSNIYNTLFWANVIKKRMPDCFIVIGGNHASYIAKECLQKSSGLDAVVRFEGEIPFKMICKKVSEKDYNFSDIPSLTYRKNGKIKENSLIGFVEDISKFPRINRKYFHQNQKGKEITHADIITARGCPFNCTFCNCNHFWHKKYRMMTTKSVIEEIKELKSENPKLKSIRFRDESITIKKDRCIKLCNELLKNNLIFEYQAHSRLDGLDEEVIKALSSSGFKLLFIGIESGSKEVLNRINKDIDITRAEKVISLLRKYGINFRISFLTSTPGEKFWEAMETVRLIRKLKLKKDQYYFGFGISIYPGTYECKSFLNINPDYEWLTKEYKFKNKYLASRDPHENILCPVYREFGTFRYLLLLLFLGREYLLREINHVYMKFTRRKFKLKNRSSNRK